MLILFECVTLRKQMSQDQLFQLNDAVVIVKLVALFDNETGSCAYERAVLQVVLIQLKLEYILEDLRLV